MTRMVPIPPHGPTEFTVFWWRECGWVAIADGNNILGRGDSVGEAAGKAMTVFGTTEADYAVDDIFRHGQTLRYRRI